MNYVTQLDAGFNTAKLLIEASNLVSTFNLSHLQQISLTSKTGDNDWECAIGRTDSFELPESEYNIINKYLEGSYIEECIARYPDYYRWRILRLQPRASYSIHQDKLYDYKDNIRLHIPILTNHSSLMYFYDIKQDQYNVEAFHLKEGYSYQTDTTGLHSAVNHGTTERIHIVGVTHK